MRRRARVVRPSLSGLSRRELQRTAPTEVALMLCRVGVQAVWSSLEVVVLVFGGPRKGKSSLLVGRIIEAPGAALVASTKHDLLRDTRELRAGRGPVFVFNPSGDGGTEAVSTIGFDPLTGCGDAVAAGERALDMIAAARELGGGSGGGDRAYWDGQARRVLAAFLHAAALGDRAMLDVQRWVADPDAAESDVKQLLRRSTAAAVVADAEQFISTNERTRTSITSSIMPALAWLTDPAATAAGTSGPDRPALDIERLLVERGTVYLLGGEKAHVAPLVGALTGYVAREAKRLAALAPGGRLDPPLTLLLDEAALICPVPLDRWSADMGGRGVCIVAAFQSRAQMIERYGPPGAATIMNNAGSKVLFGGTSDRDDLNWWTTLAGERDERITTTDPHGRETSRTVRKVPVLAPAQLAQLPDHKVVVFAPNMPPVIGWAERSWQRPDVRALTCPDALDVRARAWRARAVAGVRARLRSWIVRPVVAGWTWLATSTGRLLAGGRAWVRLIVWRSRTADTAAEAHPVVVAEEPTTGAGVGAEVSRFPTREWVPGRDDEPDRGAAGGGPADVTGSDARRGVDPKWRNN